MPDPVRVASIDVGGTKIAGAIVEYAYALDGETAQMLPPVVCETRSCPTLPLRGGDAVLADIVQIARELVLAAGGQVDGIGVACAGVVDPKTGSIRYASDIMPGWTGQPVRKRLEDEFGLPVAVLGDVQAHALGEARWGTAKGSHSCLCVGIGTGLGGAYVLDGQVLKGFRGAAGHIGHTLHPAAAGLKCACGSPAHVETVTSGVAISAMYQGRAFSDELDPDRMGDYVSAQADQGELEAIAVLEAAGRALGEAIGSWCNLFDPELVVLSGTVTQAGAFWRRALDEGFKSQVMAPLADTPILYAALGGQAPLVGAAENLLDALRG